MSNDAPEPERADAVVPGGSSKGMIDAEEFLAFTDRLRTLHRRVDGARVSDERRARWQRRLLAITEAAGSSLERADEQLSRFEAELERHLDS